MTLLVALKGEDGLVLAADSRGTFGDPRGITAQNDNQKKAHILSPHVALLAAGSGELGALLVGLARTTIKQMGVDGASEVLDVLRNTCRSKYEEWFPSIPPIQPLAMLQTGHAAARPDLGFLVGGYETDGTPRIFGLGSMLDFAPMLHDYGFAVLGVAQYALYLLNRLYEANRTTQELTSLAVYVITETASQDGKVGGAVSVITIRPGNEGCKAMDPAAVLEVQNANSPRTKALRDSFYKREVVGR